MHYSIVDIETTGGSPAYHKITEICILIHDGQNIIRRFHTLVNPGRTIPPSITLLTGINDSMVANAPIFEEIASTVFDLLENTVFVAHNVNFDYSFLKTELALAGYALVSKKLCTVRLSRKLLPGLRSYNLGNICHHVGIGIQNRHRAAGDAEATAELFSMLLSVDPEQTFIQYSLKKNSKEPSLPPNIDKAQFNNLPSTTGVYYFHDRNGKIIYTGKAQNIQQRVSEHFSGNTHTKTRQYFLNSIYDLSFETTGSELIALLLENEAIKKHYPRYNRTNKSFVLNYGFYTYEDQNGYMRLAIAPCGKRDKPILTFKTLGEATANALARVKKLGLCLRLCNITKAGTSCTYYAAEEQGHYCMVCHGKMDADEYNEVFAKAFLNQKNERTFVIKTKGRNADEEGFVIVEKGKFLGYGYVPVNTHIKKFNELKDYVLSCYDTQDSQSIVQSFLKQSQLLIQKPIEVYACPK
jgi:DNA polymerase-3 subunit epsilon